MNTNLLQFYLGLASDNEGRMLKDILTWQDPKQWESSHSFIQWVFPLQEPSKFNPNAPLLDEETLELFKASETCMKNASLAYVFAQRFLWQQFGVGWLNKGDHNHLRITRIIKFLHLVGYPIAAKTVYHTVVKIARGKPEAVSPVTLQFWREAAGIPETP